MREVILYEIHKRKVLATGNYLEVKHYPMDSLKGVLDTNEIMYDATFRTSTIPIRTYQRYGEERKYFAIDDEVAEVLDIEITRTDHERWLSAEIMRVRDQLEDEKLKLKHMTWKEHLRHAWNKLTGL